MTLTDPNDFWCEDDGGTCPTCGERHWNWGRGGLIKDLCETCEAKEDDNADD